MLIILREGAAGLPSDVCLIPYGCWHSSKHSSLQQHFVTVAQFMQAWHGTCVSDGGVIGAGAQVGEKVLQQEELVAALARRHRGQPNPSLQAPLPPPPPHPSPPPPPPSPPHLSMDKVQHALPHSAAEETVNDVEAATHAAAKACDKITGIEVGMQSAFLVPCRSVRLPSLPCLSVHLPSLLCLSVHLPLPGMSKLGLDVTRPSMPSTAVCCSLPDAFDSSLPACAAAMTQAIMSASALTRIVQG